MTDDLELGSTKEEQEIMWFKVAVEFAKEGVALKDLWAKMPSTPTTLRAVTLRAWIENMNFADYSMKHISKVSEDVARIDLLETLWYRWAAVTDLKRYELFAFCKGLKELPQELATALFQAWVNQNEGGKPLLGYSLDKLRKINIPHRAIATMVYTCLKIGHPAFNSKHIENLQAYPDLYQQALLLPAPKR